MCIRDSPNISHRFRASSTCPGGKWSISEPHAIVRWSRRGCTERRVTDLPEIPLVLDSEFRRPDELDELFSVETQPLGLPLGRGRHVVHALRQRRHTRTDQRPVTTSTQHRTSSILYNFWPAGRPAVSHHCRLCNKYRNMLVSISRLTTTRMCH